MKKVAVLVAILVCLISSAHAQNGWVTFKADSKVSIKFPIEPLLLDANTYCVIDSSKKKAFMFTAIDFVKAGGIDSLTLIRQKNTPEFVAKLKTTMEQTLTGVNLTDFSIGKWKGYTSYNSFGLDDEKKRYDIFIFIIGDVGYCLSTVTKEGVPLNDRDKFFSSVILTP
jgi:hypothetical protein